MDCAEKRRLLRDLTATKDEYQAALQRCRVCQSCIADSPEARTVCQIDSFIERHEKAHEAVMKHFEEHAC